jgi:hypothetical protein
MSDLWDLIYANKLFVDGRPVTGLEVDLPTGKVNLELAGEWDVDGDGA